MKGEQRKFVSDKQKAYNYKRPYIFHRSASTILEKRNSQLPRPSPRPIAALRHFYCSIDAARVASASARSARLVRRADAPAKCAVHEDAEARAREERGGAQGVGVRRFCARAAREFCRVVLRAALGGDGCVWVGGGGGGRCERYVSFKRFEIGNAQNVGCRAGNADSMVGD
jgi:hypothetical protein